MEGLLTVVVLSLVAAVAISLALFLEWWSVRGVLALVATRTAESTRASRRAGASSPGSAK